jgi:hypothetical protein
MLARGHPAIADCITVAGKMAKANALRGAHFRLPPYPDTLAGLEQVRDRERET